MLSKPKSSILPSLRIIFKEYLKPLLCQPFSLSLNENIPLYLPDAFKCSIGNMVERPPQMVSIV